VLGADASGIVEAVGSEVTRFKPGDEVMAFTQYGSGYGAFSEYSLYHSDTTFKVSVPNSIWMLAKITRDICAFIIETAKSDIRASRNSQRGHFNRRTKLV
jgi:hypothetical protein